jgi:choline kinase
MDADRKTQTNPEPGKCKKLTKTRIKLKSNQVHGEMEERNWMDVGMHEDEMDVMRVGRKYRCDI